MTAFSNLSASDFATSTQALLPRGRAWPRRADSLLYALCQAVGDCLAVVHAWFVTLLDVESDPSQTVQLLPAWETDFGLPDACAPSSQTVAERQAALTSKITASLGGQSATYFESVAAALGYSITIKTWDCFQLGSTPLGSPLVRGEWRFAWQVTTSGVAVSRFTLGKSQLGEPFWSLNATGLECRFRKLAPAYSTLWFDYT